MVGFTREDFENIRNSLFDPDGGADAVFWLHATTAYIALRVSLELLFPTNIRGYTAQQYIVTLLHQAALLPLCLICWISGLLPEAPIVVYLLTGAYLASDSLVNYTPVSGVVAGAERKPAFSWSVHAHHVLTVVLCALGPNLPPPLVAEGAICILLGEGGSLWITVTLLRPNSTNFLIRFYSFLISRVLGVAIAVDIARQIESQIMRAMLLTMVVGLAYDNWRTLSAMRKNAKSSGSGSWPF